MTCYVTIIHQFCSSNDDNLHNIHVDIFQFPNSCLSKISYGTFQISYHHSKQQHSALNGANVAHITSCMQSLPQYQTEEWHDRNTEFNENW
jgi:hypothetical protein